MLRHLHAGYLGRFVQSETTKWATTIKAGGIKID